MTSKVFKKVIFIFLFSIILKIFLSFLIKAPSVVNDGYVYSKMAHSFFHYLSFEVHTIPTSQYPPLYPILLSPAFLLKKMVLIYPAFKVINSVISSLIVFPAFFLAREFLNKKDSLKVALIIAFLPSSFVISPLLLSENLFYPLFLFSFYFTYLATKHNRSLYYSLSAFFISLSFLTRPTAIAFIPAVFITGVYLIYKNKISIRNIFIWIAIALLTISPWVIRNISQFGLSLSSVLGRNYVSDVTSNSAVLTHLVTLDWIFIYLGIIALATLFLFPASIPKFLKNKPLESVLLYSTLFFFILVAASHGSSTYIFKSSELIFGRLLHTRHIDVLLPLIVIFGFAGLKYKSKKEPIFLLLISIFSLSQLLIFSQRLFPPNNSSLVYSGIFKSFLDFIVYKSITPLNFTLISSIIILLSVILFFLLLKRYKSHFTTVFLVFCVLTSGLGSVLLIYNANTFWYDSPHTELGLWLAENSNSDSVIIYDSDSCVEVISKNNQKGLCEKGNLFIPSAFWLNSNIKIGTKEEPHDFFISIRRLDRPIKQFDNFYIYKNHFKQREISV